MKKITINTILATLAVDNTMKWTVNLNDGNLRAKQRKNGPCYCPLTAYVKLEHNIEVDEQDVVDFCTVYTDIDPEDIDIMIEVSDQVDFGDIIKHIEFDDDKITNTEIRKKNKLRNQLLMATRTCPPSLRD